MSKIVKKMELDALGKNFAGVRDMVLLTSNKVDAALDHSFRTMLRAKNVRLQMVKNSLVKRVLEQGGVKVDGVWAGTTLIAWGSDSVKNLSKAVDEALKVATKKDPKVAEKIKVKTAVAEGQAVPMARALTMPTRLEAIGEIVGMILGPGSAIAGCLTGPASQIASQIQTLAERKPEAAAVPDAVPEPPAA